MERSTVEIPTDDGVADAYLVRPHDAAGRPGVLLMMDAFGLRPQLELMADRIADAGYVVLAPNLFYRGGRAPVLPMPDFAVDGARQSFFAKARPLMGALTQAHMAADGSAYLDALAKESAGGPVGVVGYCMGARAGWRVATAHADRVAALAGFHGGGYVTDDPESPHRSAAALASVVTYFGHADHDGSNTAAQIAALDEALGAAGVEHTTEVYADAPHGFTQSDTPSYRADADARHYEALLGLFRRTLG